ncbi:MULTISPECIES: hypothetical protein [unclassified Roseofilum]|nr:MULTISPECIES: hypothetical protein [unclassified Roseofilum]
MLHPVQLWMSWSNCTELNWNDYRWTCVETLLNPYEGLKQAIA